MDEAEFHRYWREVHAPLVASVASVLEIRKYVQLHTTTGPANGALASGRGAPEHFDGIAELWFDSLDSVLAAALTPEGAAAAKTLYMDETKFIDHARSPIFIGEEQSIL